MRVLLVGAGAVGSVLAARLESAGATVTLIAREEHTRAIEEHGLVIEGVGAGTFRPAARALLAAGPPEDAYVLAVKTFDLEAAARELAAHRSPRPTLLVQNGLDVEATAARGLAAGGWTDPAHELVRAVQSVPATWIGPGRVRATGTGEIVLPDPAVPGPASDAARTWLELLRSTSLPVRTTLDLAREVWRKVLVNAAINPVTAIHGVANGALLEPPLREEARGLLEEARRVAEREGAGFSREEAVGELDRVARATASNRSSMLQDVERGRPTEIDAISGAILARGRSAGVSLPATEAAIRAVRACVGRAAQRS